MDGPREGAKLISGIGADDGGGFLCLTGALLVGGGSVTPELGEGLDNDIDGWAVRSNLCDIKIT